MPADSKPRGPGQSNLSRAERQYRGKIGTAKRYGRDTSELRNTFDELQATRQLREAAERLVAARQAQGLPAGVTDSAVLARIAALLIAEPSPAPAMHDNAGGIGTTNHAAGVGPGTDDSTGGQGNDRPPRH